MRDEKKKQTMISNRLNKPGGAPRHDPFALDVISIRTVACKENSSYNSMVPSMNCTTLCKMAAALMLRDWDG